MKPFLGEDYLLQTESAKTLYHDFAKDMPIFDYHCHLSVQDIAENRIFENLTQIWLNGDHYKWRAMRANGIKERFITGDAMENGELPNDIELLGSMVKDHCCPDKFTIISYK